jgi:hypothetical protein
MPLPNQSSTSLRYLKARLRILKRPMVWGSASALILAVLLFSEYWKHSDKFNLPTAESGRGPSSGVASLDSLPDSTANVPSREDSAIGVDIDSLPVLIEGLNANQSPGANPASANGSSTSPVPSAVPSNTASPQSQPVAQAPLASRNNPFLGNSQQRSRPLFDFDLPNISSSSDSNSNSSGSATTSTASTGLASGIDLLATPSQPTPTASTPLQTSLERVRASSSSQGNTGDRTQNQSEEALTSSDTRLAPGQPIPESLLPSRLRPSPAPVQMYPSPGTTGYTLPPTLRNVPSSAPGSSSSTYANPTGYQSYPGVQAPQIAPPVLNQQTRYGQSTAQPPGYNSNLPTGVANPYSAPQINPNSAPRVEPVEVEPLPFTAPYSRGGGEFNTFSNP